MRGALCSMGVCIYAVALRAWKKVLGMRHEERERAHELAVVYFIIRAPGAHARDDSSLVRRRKPRASEQARCTNSRKSHALQKVVQLRGPRVHARLTSLAPSPWADSFQLLTFTNVFRMKLFPPLNFISQRL